MVSHPSRVGGEKSGKMSTSKDSDCSQQGNDDQTLGHLTTHCYQTSQSLKASADKHLGRQPECNMLAIRAPHVTPSSIPRYSLITQPSVYHSTQLHLVCHATEVCILILGLKGTMKSRTFRHSTHCHRTGQRIKQSAIEASSGQLGCYTLLASKKA